MKKHITYYFIFFFVFYACGKKDPIEENAVARVYDSYLYKKDVEKLIPIDVTGNDSILLAKNYVNRWVKEQLLFKKAEINLNENSSEIDELVQKYRNDLLINRYKEEVVKQYLDTIVTSLNIDQFYNENKEIFKLNEELVKLRYIHFGNDLLNPDEFEELFRSNKKEDLDSLVAKEIELKSINLNDSVWVRLDDVKRKLPVLKGSDISLILKKAKFLEKKDSLGVYLVAVKNVLKRNEIAPISYITPTIKQMILHNRKLELIRKIEETLVDDAINNQEFEVYEDNK